jgi:hypothetical protein
LKTRPGAHVTRLALLGLLVGVCVAAPRWCAAAVASRPSWVDEVTLNGFLSTSYSYNFNRPASGTNQFRVFDFDDDTFKLDEFELVAQKTASKVRDTGFRVDMTLGSSVSRVAASGGLFRDAAGIASDIDVHQAFVSYVAPAGSGLRFDAGKFITGHGYEVIDGYDGWNDNATRSVLFGYAIPFTHVGLRASYTFSPRVSGMAMLVNGWDVARDNNRARSLGAQLTLTPRPPLTILISAMTGPERTGNDSDRRNLLDVVAILKATTRLTLGANVDFGTEENAVGPGQDAGWSGAAAYARMTSKGPWALSARVEAFSDSDGARTGVAQTIKEFTLTPERRLSPHLLLRADLRVDRSDQQVFDDSPGLTRTQPTVLFNAIYSF